MALKPVFRQSSTPCVQRITTSCQLVANKGVGFSGIIWHLKRKWKLNTTGNKRMRRRHDGKWLQVILNLVCNRTGSDFWHLILNERTPHCKSPHPFNGFCSSNTWLMGKVYLYYSIRIHSRPLDYSKNTKLTVVKTKSPLFSPGAHFVLPRPVSSAWKSQLTVTSDESFHSEESHDHSFALVLPSRNTCTA